MITDIWKAINEEDIDLLAMTLLNEPNLVDKESEWGDTPLKLAIEAGQIDSVNCLLSYGANPNKELNLLSPISGRKNEKMAPLMFARKINIIETLIAAGANINARDSSGKSVLFFVGKAYDIDLLNCLIKHGANLIKDEIEILQDLSLDELEYRKAVESNQTSERITRLEKMVEWCKSNLPNT